MGVPRWPYQRGAQHVCATSGAEDDGTLPSLEIEAAHQSLRHPQWFVQAPSLILAPGTLCNAGGQPGAGILDARFLAALSSSRSMDLAALSSSCSMSPREVALDSSSSGHSIASTHIHGCPSRLPSDTSVTDWDECSEEDDGMDVLDAIGGGWIEHYAREATQQLDTPFVTAC